MMQTNPAMAEILDALAVQVPADGWTGRSLRLALASLGQPPEDAPLLFPGGAREMVEAFCALADSRMAQAAAGLESARRSTRVREIIALRFAQNRGQKAAIRRGLAVLSLPQNAARAARCTAATVDTIWATAGDNATDFSWYSKRAILAAVYGACLLFWLADDSPEDSATLAFLDRRLAGVARLGGWRKLLAARLRQGAAATRPAA